MINVIATLTVKSGEGPALEEAVASARGEVLANPRCHRYDLQRRRRSETDYLMLETWESTEALKEHGASDAFLRLGERLSAVLAAAPEVTVLDPMGDQVALA